MINRKHIDYYADFIPKDVPFFIDTSIFEDGNRLPMSQLDAVRAFNWMLDSGEYEFRTSQGIIDELAGSHKRLKKMAKHHKDHYWILSRAYSNFCDKMHNKMHDKMPDKIVRPGVPVPKDIVWTFQDKNQQEIHHADVSLIHATLSHALAKNTPVALYSLDYGLNRAYCELVRKSPAGRDLYGVVVNDKMNRKFVAPATHAFS